jgi:hypothetical protein
MRQKIPQEALEVDWRGIEVADPIKLAGGLRTSLIRHREQLARQNGNEGSPVHR